MRRRLIALFGAVLTASVVTAGLLHLMRQPLLPPRVGGERSPTTAPSERGPVSPANAQAANASAVATVDGVAITYPAWQTATRLDAVMSELTGQPIPSAEETLDRMINEILLLRGAGLEDATVAPDEVQARISDLEASWGLNDAQVLAALETRGLNRQALLDRMARLILVEQAIQSVSSHSEVETWLAQARRSAHVERHQPLTAIPSAEAATPTPPPTPTPASTPTPDPTIAPDFTLRSAGGATVTLSDYEGQSSVVLVFYRGQT